MAHSNMQNISNAPTTNINTPTLPPNLATRIADHSGTLGARATEMAESELYFSLLRISAAQALRAAGLTTAKPSVLDAFTDITTRYLCLLASTTRSFAELSNRPEPTLSDVRAAMEHLGLIHPVTIFHRGRSRKRRRLDLNTNPHDAAATLPNPTNFNPVYSALELINNPHAPFPMNRSIDMLDPGELLLGQRGVEEVGAWGEDEEDEDEDTRGVDALIEWFKGPVAAEMRRVAGITTVSSMDGTGGAGTGAGAGNSSNVAPAVAVGNTGAGAPASVGTGSGILPSTGAGEAVMEAGPITWLNGLKSKPERWKGTAIGPPADDVGPIKIEGGPVGEEVPTL